MPINPSFFKKQNTSSITLNKGPAPEEQLIAMVEDRYWTVLNSHLLRNVPNDPVLLARANALKFGLQTYGPTSPLLAFTARPNKGKSEGYIFHGDFDSALGVTYILEWAIIDPKERILAIVGFGKHENYPFQQKPLTKEKVTLILADDVNKKIFDNVKDKIEEAKAKVKRVCENYRFQN